MTISSLDDLLRSTRTADVAQRLLFVFSAAGLPDDATPEQRAEFHAGNGGTLTPLMCVDKSPDELASFDELLDESRRTGQAWDIVFVAAMSVDGDSGQHGARAEALLQRMVDSVSSGDIERFVAFDQQGRPVVFG